MLQTKVIGSQTSSGKSFIYSEIYILKQKWQDKEVRRKPVVLQSTASLIYRLYDDISSNWPMVRDDK